MIKHFAFLTIASTSFLLNNASADSDNCLEVSEILRGYDIPTKFSVISPIASKHNGGRVSPDADLSSKENQDGQIDNARFEDTTREKSMFERFTGWVVKQVTKFCKWISG